MEEEIKKLQEILILVEENLKRNDILYTNVLKTTEDEYLIGSLEQEFYTKEKSLKRAQLTPYFARIDFKQDNLKQSIKEEIYIGKATIFDDDSNVAVVDWRAPIASIYYDGKIGKTKYECPEGIIEGELSLKRQYTIENGKLINYRDVDITTNDEMLQDCLNEKSDKRLKNIVSTIQSERNQIIRANMFKPLIVQGVAGSGKTTVALHRIAYLVYTYKENFKADDFLILAPNKFFLDYISNVLPDLGVENVKQQTFEEFAMEIIKTNIKVLNPNIELSKIVENSEDASIVKKSAIFKSSLNFKIVIDNYLNNLYKNILPQKNFEICKIIIFEHKELQSLLEDALKRNSLNASLKILTSIMEKRLKERSNNIIDIITESRKEKLDKISEENKKERMKIFEETEYEISNLLKGGKKLVKDYIKGIKLRGILEYYKEILNNKENLLKYIDSATAEYVIKELNNNVKNKKIEYEDVAALLYLQYKIYGLQERFSLKHIVIDEAQDFSEFQFYVLNEVLGNNKSMTILGDIAQGIYSYRGTNNWQKINEEVFGGDAKIEMLSNSYRTTYEIMNEANKILSKISSEENLNLAIPLSRHGRNVTYTSAKKFEEKIMITLEKIKELQNQGFKNIAVIAKDADTCLKIQKKLEDYNIFANLISNDLIKYEGGLIVVPSYLSKGLEFDNVIIFDYDKYSSSKLDIKLLYVAFTRAMHTLDVIKD